MPLFAPGYTIGEHKNSTRENTFVCVNGCISAAQDKHTVAAAATAAAADTVAKAIYPFQNTKYLLLLS